jgi:hypothetical protein
MLQFSESLTFRFVSSTQAAATSFVLVCVNGLGVITSQWQSQMLEMELPFQTVPHLCKLATLW